MTGLGVSQGDRNHASNSGAAFSPLARVGEVSPFNFKNDMGFIKLVISGDCSRYETNSAKTNKQTNSSVNCLASSRQLLGVLWALTQGTQLNLLQVIKGQ